MILDSTTPARFFPLLPSQAKDIYSQLVGEVRRQHQADRVKDGVFGAKMDVALVNDGPVTFVVDSADPDG